MSDWQFTKPVMGYPFTTVTTQRPALLIMLVLPPVEKNTH